MKITWFGHSAFRIDHNGEAILIDPFLSGNPSWGKGWEDAASGATHVLLTHGHDDHLGDAAAICKATGAQLVANFEIAMYLAAQGVDGGKLNPGNQGGTVNLVGLWSAPGFRDVGVAEALLDEVRTWAQQREARALLDEMTALGSEDVEADLEWLRRDTRLNAMGAAIYAERLRKAPQ